MLFTRVSGIGPSKAIELVEKGARTIQDLENFKDQLTHHQLIGLKYFYDFEEKIPRSEISKIEKIIVKEVCQIDSDCIGMQKNFFM